MEIKITEQLKKYRIEKGNTQEELARYLGISTQAVSKWERGEGYPDISLLHKIAFYYTITVDELLGVDEIRKQERIDEITYEYNKIRHHEPLDKDWHIDEGIELIRNALKDFPHNDFFSQLLASDLWWKGRKSHNKEEYFEEARELCLDILSNPGEQRWRNCANEILLVIYADMGEKEKALEIAYQMPTPRGSMEYALTYILEGKELKRRLKRNIEIFKELLAESQEKLNGL